MMKYNKLGVNWKFLLLMGVFVLLQLSFSTVSATGIITPVGSGHSSITIKSHEVNVSIENGFAITRVDQVFHNPNSEDLEAVYQFPLPKDAVTAEFTLWIDGQPVTAEVLEKNKARKTYAAEKKAGRRTGLTEKNQQHTFDISVYPVRASQDLKIRFVYIQSLEVDHGVGRYVYPLENGGTDSRQNAFWTSNAVVEEVFKFNVDVKSGYPVEALRLPQQPLAQITQNSSGHWAALITNSVGIEEDGQSNQTKTAALLDKDIVVYWRLKQDLPGSVDFITYKPDVNGRGTFMLTLTPAKDLAKIEQGIDWNFVLDISGSMQGKYATLARGVNQALGKLREQDRFRIILFNNSARELTNGYVYATADNVSNYMEKVESTKPNGGTNVYDGLTTAINSLDTDRASGIILVTDGVANVGQTEFKHFRKLLKKRDVRLFSFIMGNSANNELIDFMTKTSNGFSQSVSNSDDIVGHILTAASKITHQAYRDIDVSIHGVSTADITPATINSLYQGQQLVLLGHYWDGGMVDVNFSGKVGGEKREYQSSFEFPSQSEGNPEIERLWAFNQIKIMSEDLRTLGFEQDTKQAITDLAIEYGLVTDYTSMLIVENDRFTDLGIDQNNKQRLDTEKNAQSIRQSQSGSNNRVDQGSPMFSGNRSSLGGGGGAIHPLMLIGLIGIVLGARRLQNLR